MKIVESDAVLLDRKNKSQLEVIELAGRTCYKSLENITEGSAIEFCKRMKNSKHYAMLEHGIVHILFEGYTNSSITNPLSNDLLNFMKITPFTADFEAPDIESYIITASIRSFLEYFDSFTEEDDSLLLLNALNAEYPDIFGELYSQHEDFLTSSTAAYVKVCKILTDDELREKILEIFESEKRHGVDAINANKEVMRHTYHTVVFTCDRGVTHEFVRHRPASFAQESTRYCNYSKGKFGQEITVVKPCDFNAEQLAEWKTACEDAEKHYFKLLDMGCQAQQARGVLPTDLKAEIVITANEIEWQHIINLRYHGKTGAPHPHMVEVMTKAYPKLVEASHGRLL